MTTKEDSTGYLDIARLQRRHNTRYKLARSEHWPEEKWHVAQWRSYQRRWQNVIVNATLEEAFDALKSVGAITLVPSLK